MILHPQKAHMGNLPMEVQFHLDENPHRLNGSDLLLVMTSGGVISVLMQRALGFEDDALVRVNLALKNTAINEFLISKSNWNVQSFNSVPYLAEAHHQAWHTRV